MSRELAFPIDFKNETGVALPPRSIFMSASSGNTGEYLIAGEAAADGDEALFITEPREIADDGYGKCRSIFQGPFWVRYSGSAPSAADTVGPVSSETYVDGTGSGFKVLAVDVTNEIVLCAATTDSGTIRDAELTAGLSAASDSKTGASTASAKFLVPDPDNPGDLMDGDTFTVTNRSLDATGLSGDYLVVAKIGSEWRLIWIDC